MTSLSLFEAIQDETLEAAFFLTYTLNLRFFEQLVLPRLRRAGAARIGILADVKGYQDSLADPLAPEHCGRAYAIGAVDLPGGGIQHAKVLWLKGREHVVFIGSHNLTMAGFNDQAELTVRLCSSVPGHVEALRDLHAVVTRIMTPTLMSVWDHIPVPEQSSPPAPATVKMFSSLDVPLIDQLAEAIGIVEHLHVVTPFLDAGTLKRLVERCGPTSVLLDIPREGTNKPLREATAAVPEVAVRSFASKTRRLHAKAFVFRTQGSTHTAIGSANCTRAALERTATTRGGNVELLALLEDTPLPDEGETFLPVNDPANFPGTGQVWDEVAGIRNRIAIQQAVYRNGQLVVDWHARFPLDAATVRLQAGNVEMECRESPVIVTLSAAPRTVSITNNIDGAEQSSTAWVLDHEALEEFAGHARTQRWAERLVVEDPLQHASSIAIWLEQTVLDLLRSDLNAAAGGEGNGAATTAWGDREKPTKGIRHYVEIFAFASDSAEIHRGAEEFVRDSVSRDPLAVLRAVLARLVAPPPASIENDPDALRHFDHRKYRAQSRAREGWTRDLQRLTRRLRPHPAIAPDLLEAALTATFGATADMADTLFFDPKIPTAAKVHLAKAYADLIEVLYAHAPWRAMLRHPEVAAPLALSQGITAAIARSCADHDTVDRLMKYGRALIGRDPRPLLDAWRAQHPQQADTLLAEATGVDRFAQWMSMTLQLFGIAIGHVRDRVTRLWGLLLELQAADIAHDARRDALFAAAAAQIGDTSIWRHYVAARMSVRLPVVFEVSQPVCAKCRIKLPTVKQGMLYRGEAVVCDCGAILLLKS